MKLKGYIFYENGTIGEITQGASSGTYRMIWEALQDNALDGVQGYLVLKEEDDE